MSQVDLARAMFGTIVGFHILFATLGVGIPFFILLAELMAVRTGNRDYAQLARRWTRGFVVLLGVGVVSGTIVALQLTLLWPSFMQLVGQVAALPLLIEVFAFFLEALFAGIYVYGGERLSPRVRILSTFLVAVGAALSAVLITDLNAFMNTPTGFRLLHGRVLGIQPWVAVFNPSMPTQVLHVLSSAYLAVAFVLAAIAAWALLRERTDDREAAYHRHNLRLTLTVGGIMAVTTALIGDLAGKFLAVHQGAKLAAAEGLFHTTSYAPLVVGGWADPGIAGVRGGVVIPGALSYLATGRLDGVVQGLDRIPKNLWPPLVIHPLFDLMVGIGFWLLGVALVFWLGYSRSSSLPRGLLGAVLLSGPLAMAGILFGWVFDEMGRQPWTVTGVLKTADAATASPGVGWLFGLFVALYAILFAGTALALRSYFRKHPFDPEWAPIPMGPGKRPLPRLREGGALR